jgi:hypothetical protein
MGGDRPLDKLPQHIEVDVDKVLQVEAALAGLVRTEPCNERRVPVFEAAHEVHDEVALAW